MQHRGALATILGGRKSPFPRLGAVTTAPGQSVTIQEWNATAATIIDWGDGQTTNHPALTGTTVSHVYSVAGSYIIQLKVNPLAVRRIDLRDVALRPNTAYLRYCTGITFFKLQDCLTIFDSAHLSGMALTSFTLSDLPAGSTVNFDSFHLSGMVLTYFLLDSLPAGSTVNFDSSHLSGMALTYFLLYNLPVGSTVNFDSSHLSAMSLTFFYLSDLSAGSTVNFDSSHLSAMSLTFFLLNSLPAGSTINFDSTHLSAMALTFFYLSNLPAGSTIAVAAADFDGWPAVETCNVNNNLLTQVQVDAILQGLYAGLATRTATGGTISVGDNNAAPSGLLQAMCPPTTGKERAYELVNDSCGVNPTKKWATVTITA